MGEQQTNMVQKILLLCTFAVTYVCAAPVPRPLNNIIDIAVNKTAGSKIWSFPTGNYVDSSPALSSDGKVVYVGSGDHSLYAVNALTGSKIWSFATGDGVSSSPALSSDGKVVYVGSTDQSLYAVNALTGSKIWSFPTGGFVRSSPTLSSDGKVVYVGSYDYNFYAVDALTGSKIWSFPTGDPQRGGAVTSSVLSSDDKVVYIGCTGYNSLYAVNVSTASKIWAFANRGRPQSPPVLSSDGKVVYFDSYAVHASTGSEIWTFEDADFSSSPALSSDGKVLYVGSQDDYAGGKGGLRALNALTGSKIWSFATGGPVHSTPVLSSDGKVYVGSVDHSLYAVNTDSSLFNANLAVSGVAVHWSRDATGDVGNCKKEDGNVTIIPGNEGAKGQLVASCNGSDGRSPVTLYCQVTASAGALSLQAHFTISNRVHDYGPVVHTGCSTIMISGNPDPDAGQCCFV